MAETLAKTTRDMTTRRKGRPQVKCEGPESDHVQVRGYHPPNWFTASGVAKKRRQIELRGLPDFKAWRFITLTIDPKKFEGPLQAYLTGKAKLKRFMEDARSAGLWSVDHKWAWKLEFHRSGWPHWHLLVSQTAKFTHDQLRSLDELWGLGDASCEMVRQDGFLYSFKYAFKGVIQRDEFANDFEFFEDDASVVPDWFLDYAGEKLVKVKWIDAAGIEHSSHEYKPTSFTKIRFWQTSAGFYTGEKPLVSNARKPQLVWIVPQPVRVAFDRSPCQCQVVARDRFGNYRSSSVFPMSRHIGYLFQRGSRAHTFGDGLALGISSYLLPVRDLKTEIQKQQLWTLLPLLSKNRLQLRQATRLQKHGKCWKTS